MFCLLVPGFVIKTFRRLVSGLPGSGAATVLFVAFSSKRKRRTYIQAQELRSLSRLEMISWVCCRCF